MPTVHNQRLGYLQRFSLTIIGSLEKFFYNWGYNIACHPWAFIITCLCFSAACGIGLLSFTPEDRPDKLWIPWNSEFVRDSDWLRENFPSPIRFHYVILTAEDIFQPEVIQQLYEIHKAVSSISAQGITWEDVCFKLPVTKFVTSRRRRRQSGLSPNGSEATPNPFENFGSSFDSSFDFEDDLSPDVEDSEMDFTDFSIGLGDDVYCDIINNLEEACWESNLLELWNYDDPSVVNLTRQQVLDKINSRTESPVFGRLVNYTTDLGFIERNEKGKIVNAKAIYLRWHARINQTALAIEGKALNDLGTGERVDSTNLIWETKLSQVLLNKSQSMPPGISMYFSTARSFGDISGATIMNDAGMLAVGFGIVFVYVVFMLGKFNMIEQRPMLSSAGLSCVGLAILVSYGLCSAFKAIYGPVHNVLPFLLMGIGIDDMFVIMQCWNNLKPAECKRSLPERMGLTLKHAGVSITVTSVTDFVAFAIGGTTVLPALQSFCIYAALGVIATYIFQATFFVAWFSLDQRRIENNKNAFIICIRHTEYKKNECSQRSYSKLFFEKIYSKIMFTTPAKIIVFLVTGGILGINIWGNFELRQEFNPIWFLPQDSYLFQYFMAKSKYYSDIGDDGFVIVQNVSFPENLLPFESLVKSLEASESLYEVDTWYYGFKNYSNTNFKTKIPDLPISSEDFQTYLGKFLFSPSGSKYRGRFKMNGNLTCGESAPPISLTSISFKFKSFKGPEEHLPAMREIKKIVKSNEFNRGEGTRIFAWSFAFAGWETDEIITAELYRNMALAMVCVLMTTLVLIANFPACVMVLTCVVFTLVDVGGMMHFWGLTIDTVSCIDLVLAIGLCVDYAAHIGHAFMVVVGTRDERAKQALVNIGPAVINGGFSTFLAFVLLANSRSHVFITFFKIFFLVVVFGVFHGIVFLPVLLSVIGPPPYPSAFSKPYVGETVELNPASNFVTGSPVKRNEIRDDDKRNSNLELNETRVSEPGSQEQGTSSLRSQLKVEHNSAVADDNGETSYAPILNNNQLSCNLASNTPLPLPQ